MGRASNRKKQPKVETLVLEPGKCGCYTGTRCPDNCTCATHPNCDLVKNFFQRTYNQPANLK